MSTTREIERKRRKPRGPGCGRQVGPWDPAETLLITMTVSGNPVALVAVTSSDPGFDDRTDYQQGEEYWALNSLAGIANLTPYGSALDLTIASQGCSDTYLDGTFFRGLPVTDEFPETPPAWTEGTYSAPDETTTYFFSMPDLDVRAQGNRVGLSLVVSSSETLVGMGWHRSFAPGSGEYAWTPPALGTLGSYLLYTGRTVDTLNVPAPSSWYYVFQEG
jgi:hypothetical protein